MNWFQKALSYIVLRTSRGVGGSAPEVQNFAGVPVNENTVLALSAVWACVNLLSGTIASLPLMVYRTDARGDRTVARDHPLYRVLHDRPNADQTAVDFWDGGNTAIELRGDMFAHKELAGDRLIALTPVYGAAVRRTDTGALRYRWTAEGRSYDEPQENMLHIRGFGGDPLGGLSTLTYGRRVFGLATAIDTAAQSTFVNGLRASGVLTLPGILKDDQRSQIEDGLARKFAGAMNAGRPIVLEGGTTWQQLTISPEDAQMLQSRGFGIEEACRFFGVPPFMIGHTEKVTSFGSGLEQQVLGFQKFTLRRRLKRIEQALEQQLLTARDRVEGITIEFNLEGLLRGDSAGRAAFYQSGLNNGWLTINEVRALENMPPVSGGEIPRMQIQNVPITEPGKVQAVSPPA